jgi:hypothetical protein
MAAGESFYQVLTAAISDFADRGYVSPTQLAYWSDQLRTAAIASMIPEAAMTAMLKQALGSIYSRMIDRERILADHPEIPRFTIERVRPELRRELDARILAAADLIKLNRQAAVEKTLQRLSGWATSLPRGGSERVRRLETKDKIRKSLASLPYEERRVAIDQSSKFLANLSDIIANAGGALAGEWRHHYSLYPRPVHVRRAGTVFLVRNCWAQNDGLVKPGPAGYVDQIERPGELVWCRCRYRWLYNLRQLPPEMLTAKGRAQLANIRLVA